MRWLSWTIGLSVLSALAASVLAGAAFEREIVLGMAGPLAIVTGSWILTEWTYRRDPASLTALMMAGFAGKMVVFGAYVAVMLKVLALRPGPFVASFTGYFIALYVVEALALQRLMAGGVSRPAA
jgi:hypothetical protein